MDKKVYCINCKWYYSCVENNFVMDECNAQENMVDCYIRKNFIKNDIPKKINKKNDCEWYQEKNGFIKFIQSLFNSEVI